MIITPMKYILLILSFTCIHFHAQSKIVLKEVGTVKVLDTLHYLKVNFEFKKSEYIGKSFSFLLKNMIKIQPKTIWNISGSTENSVVDKSLFRFHDMNYPILNETKMLVTWRTGLNSKTVDWYSKRNKYYFTNAERRVYGNLIVQDILIYR